MVYRQFGFISARTWSRERGLGSGQLFGGGGDTYEFVLDTGASPAGNIYDSFSSLYSAMSALDGRKRVVFRTDGSESSGAFDLTDVEMYVDSSTNSFVSGLALSGTATITQLPAVLGVVLTNNKTSGSMFTATLTGNTMSMVHGGSLDCQGSTSAVDLNGKFLTIHMRDNSSLGLSEFGTPIVSGASGFLTIDIADGAAIKTDTSLSGGYDLTVSYSSGKLASAAMIPSPM